MKKNDFITPETYRNQFTRPRLHGPNGWMLFAATNQGLSLADHVKREYDKHLKANSSKLKGIPLLNNPTQGGPGDRRIIQRFEDTETCPFLPSHTAGSNLYIFDYTHDVRGETSVNDNLFQLYEMVRTARVAGAKTITVVVPYLAYSRQDKPTAFKREATNAKLVADFFVTAGAHGIITYHPHSNGIRGFYEPNMRFIALDGLDLFIEIYSDRFKGAKDLSVVSTDAGGAKLTVHLAEALDIPYAISAKYRHEVDKAKVEVLGIVGDFQGKTRAIVADDESVTFTSVYNAVKQLYQEHNVAEIFVLLSHCKIRKQHIPKLIEAHEKLGVTEFHFTDSVPQSDDLLKLSSFVTRHSLAERFARTINRHHYNQSVSELFYRPNGNGDHS